MIRHLLVRGLAEGAVGSGVLYLFIRWGGARIPDWLTPGAAEALSVTVYRMVKTKQLTPQAALAEALETYQPAEARETMEFQVGLAVSEASDLSFVPESLRHFGNAEG